MKKIIYLSFFVSLAIGFSACKKKTDSFSSIKLEDYYPLQTGKYITYQLDSLVYINFGTKDTVHSYQAKFLVDSLITDNLNRPAYRIFRFIRNNDTEPWTPSGTFMAVNTTGSLEFIENNLRFLKLELPVVNDFSWKGNSYIDTYSLNSELKYMDDWDYTYANVGDPLTIGSFNFDNSVTVNQRDETLGSPDAYYEVNFSQEKYAKGVGLVYRNFLHTEYQPGSGTGDGYYADGSYGITLTVIDHN